jgi:hypothetical protein
MKYFKGFAWETEQFWFLRVCRYFVIEVTHKVICGLVLDLFEEYVVFLLFQFHSCDGVSLSYSTFRWCMICDSPRKLLAVWYGAHLYFKKERVGRAREKFSK